MPRQLTQFLLAGFCTAVLALASPGSAQDRLRLLELQQSLAPQDSTSDSLQTAGAPTRHDSAQVFLPFAIDAGYRLAPMHPYFRDEYRLIQDIRRLMLFVDRYAIIGLESMPEMLAIAHRFPESKQTEMIRTAVAGSVVNQISESVSRHLRKKKAGFVQWELEKVVFHKSFQGLHVRVFHGVAAHGFTLFDPKLGMSYSQYATEYDFHESWTYWLARRYGFTYGWYNGGPLYGPRFTFPRGYLAVNYDRRQEVLTSIMEFRRAMSAIVRLLYVNYLNLPMRDYLKVEMMLRW